MKKYIVRRGEDGVSLSKISVTERGSESVRHILPKRSQAIINHSPNGFEFGSAGSGPSQLALAILLDALTGKSPSPELAAQERYHDFKFAFIVGAKGDEFEIAEKEILEWFATTPGMIQ